MNIKGLVKDGPVLAPTYYLENTLFIGCDGLLEVGMCTSGQRKQPVFHDPSLLTICERAKTHSVLYHRRVSTGHENRYGAVMKNMLCSELLRDG